MNEKRGALPCAEWNGVDCDHPYFEGGEECDEDTYTR